MKQVVLNGKKSSNSGFSLMELMIVVAIIGILATIAIPNIQKFVSKAKQSEAKAALGTMYTCQKAYYAEQSTYSGYFQALGFAPDGKIYYNTGWSTDPGVGKPTGTAQFNSNDYCKVSGNGCNFASGVTKLTDITNASITATAFTAASVAILNSASKITDTWTINENRDINNITIGL